MGPEFPKDRRREYAQGHPGVALLVIMAPANRLLAPARRLDGGNVNLVHLHRLASKARLATSGSGSMIASVRT